MLDDLDSLTQTGSIASVYERASNFWTIVFSRFERGKWSAPRVAPFSGQYSDADEFITRDGQQMFFISKRPLPNARNKEPRKLDIWVMDKTATGWSQPRNLGAPV